MDNRESTRRTPSHAANSSSAPRSDAAAASLANLPYIDADDTSSFSSANDELLSGTGSIPLIASSTGSLPPLSEKEPTGSGALSSVSAPTAPRYVRKRTPHRSQGTLDDLTDDSIPSASYTHDSNISVGGATPLSGMAYRRARSNMSRVKNSTRYGQYLEIPKGRRSIFASRERARRRHSVLALFIVVTLLILAAMFLWNMMQEVLG
ncbi:MAG: hypothetical protein Q4C09_02415 [Atopobiaceae bacterium]|nr:hypothetical protein [Atopobiaceae bacterium]